MVLAGLWLATAFISQGNGFHVHDRLRPSTRWLSQQQGARDDAAPPSICRSATITTAAARGTVTTEGGDDDDYYDPPPEITVLDDYDTDDRQVFIGKSIKSSSEAQAIETSLKSSPGATAAGTGAAAAAAAVARSADRTGNSNTRKVPNRTMNVAFSSPDRERYSSSSSSRWSSGPSRPAARRPTSTTSSGSASPRAGSKMINEGSSWMERNTEYNKGTGSKTFREDFRGTRVFVQGIPPNTSWQTLKDHFRTAGTVVFASVSHSGETGIVQFETTDQAATAIQVMRDHPLGGSVLYVRADVQESKDGNRQLGMMTKKKRNDNNAGAFWQCASADYMTIMEYDKIEAVEAILRSRDQARRRHSFDAADSMREQLRNDYNVQLDDRSHLWWISTDDNDGDGDDDDDENGTARKSGRPAAWQQLKTDHDDAVDATLVLSLLNKRDAARRKKDFATADALLEQAYALPKDLGVSLRIHDESRTWRVWLDELPPRPDRRSSPPAARRRDSNSEPTTTTTAAAERSTGSNDDDIEDSSDNNEEQQRAECFALIERFEPAKLADVQKLLKKFPASSVLPRLRDRYL